MAMTDWKLAARGLRRRPWAAACAILSLGLGFAALIVVLSSTNAVLWRTLAVPEPERVANIYAVNRISGNLANAPYPQLDRLGSLAAFDSVAAFTRFQLAWDAGNGAEQVNVEMVSDNYFDTIRPRFAMGRPPREAGEAALGHGFWRDRFGGSRDAVGQILRLNGEEYAITGVMDGGFRGTLLDYQGNPKVWITVRSAGRIAFLRGLNVKANWAIPMFLGAARLARGATPEQAQQAVSALEKHAGFPAGAMPAEGRVFSAARSNFYPARQETVRRTLAAAVAVGSLLLLLGCLNTALFLAAKAQAESNQSAMERALGAGGWRIARRRFAEASLVCGAALALGTTCAAWWIGLLALHPPPLASIAFEPAWDWRVWLLTTGSAFVAVMIGAAAPATIALRSRATSSHAAKRSAGSRRLRDALVGLQVAAACVILIAAGFVTRTVLNAYGVDVGFDAAGVVMAQFTTTEVVRDPAKQRDIARRVLAGLRERSEVEETAVTGLIPLTHIRNPRRVRDASGASVPAFSNAVSESYFRTLRLPIERGRAFAAGQAGAREAVVNETLARMLAPNGDAVGKTLQILDARGGSQPPLVIVGVARDARYHTLWDDRVPYYYTSIESGGGGSPAIVVRARSSERAAWEAIREVVTRATPGAIVTAPVTAGSQLAALVKEQAYLSVFFGALAAIALAVAAAGLIANLSLTVTERTREIGVRQALGATRPEILRAMLFRGLSVAVAGLTVGVMAGHKAAELLAPVAPGTPRGDWVPAAVSVVVLLLAAVSASIGPAIRASRIAPWEALRSTE